MFKNKFAFVNEDVALPPFLENNREIFIENDEPDYTYIFAGSLVRYTGTISDISSGEVDIQVIKSSMVKDKTYLEGERNTATISSKYLTPITDSAMIKNCELWYQLYSMSFDEFCEYIKS